MRMQGCCGREHDEKGDSVREDHADAGVGDDAAHFAGPAARQCVERAPPFAHAPHFLDFLRRLPEKQIGTYGGAEHRDQQHQIIGGELHLGQERAERDLAPRDVDGEHHADIEKQNQRQPFEDRRIAAIGHEHLQQHRGCGKYQRVFVAQPADDEIKRFAHRRDVGRDVDDIRDNQQRDQAMQSLPP
jgi:hypothetical protein